MARGDSIEHDQQDVRRPRCRHRPRVFLDLLPAIADPERRSQESNRPEDQWQGDNDESAENPIPRLNKRHHPRRDPERDDQPRQTVDPRKSDQKRGQDDERAIARVNSQRPGAASTRATPQPNNPSKTKTPRFATGINQMKWRLIL